MASSITPKKIIKQPGISLSEASRLIQQLDWTPTYVQKAVKYPTDYKLTKAVRDPMKSLLRSYFPMQQDKNARVYGALDGALRAGMFKNMEPRWVEWMKLFLGIIPFPEISAARSMAMEHRIAPSDDLKTGFTMQMIDELRHSTIQMNLKKWYMENYIDPAGFDITERAFGKCYACTIGRQFAEGFLTGDTMTATNIFLQVVAETAFTNTLFVAMPSEAARNGDVGLPSVFLSVQADESRHMSNGHAMLVSALKNPDNHMLIERDIRYSLWQNHRIVDAAIGSIIEYGTKDRDKKKPSYAELWHRWIYEDYYRTYLLPLEKFGIKIHHDDIDEMWNQISNINKAYVHHVAQFFSAGWPVNFWRIDPLDERDFEWFEYKYPGWYRRFGAWWEDYRKLSVPNGHPPIVFCDTGYQYPIRCWSCLVPCLVHEDMKIDEVDGQLYAYCSEVCRWTHKEAFAPQYKGRPTPAMGRFAGKREWETCYHQWDLADVIRDLGFVRDDGKTLTPQPHLHFDDPKKMWTLDHVKGIEFKSPLIEMRAMTPEQREKWADEYRKWDVTKVKKI